MLANLLIGNGVFSIFIALGFMVAVGDGIIDGPRGSMCLAFILLFVFIGVNCIAIGASLK